MIEVENVWKQYKLGDTVDINKTLRETLTQKLRLSKQLSKQKDIESELDNGYFWALKELNLTVKSGRTLGLVGHNGAGKSTLLKVLSRITKPTKGKITIHGSLSSLLEVGTGFHPELSGRENIFLYGSIMGMSRRDIQRKFDEIVDYAGIEQFIDTPVKRYSSGMYVRLAFSIAAHVEPDILIVDEVLAVGDKSFREKCLGKMEDVADSGRTVIFVSHNMNAVLSLCKEVAWLDHGQIQQVGDAHSTISAYENSVANTDTSQRAASLFEGNLNQQLKLLSLSIQGNSDVFHNEVCSDHPINIEAKWQAEEDLRKLVVSLSLFQGDTRLLTIDDVETPKDTKTGEFITRFTIPAGLFRNAQLSLALGAQEKQYGRWNWAKGLANLNLTSEALLDRAHAENLLNSTGFGKRLES